MSTTLQRIKRLPGVSQWLRAKYDRRFANNERSNLFRGVFPTAEAPQATAPKTRPVGYDNPGPAAMYVERTRRVYPTDYPVMFWMRKLFDEGVRDIVDLGGHIGVSYYSYRRYLDYPKELRWRVHDVPAVMDQGRRIAAERDPAGMLQFIDDLAQADGCDLLMAQGSLQYLPYLLPDRLAAMSRPPRNLIVNLMPLHERETYYTLQSIGPAFCPYKITAQDEFLAGFQALGYAVTDAWENPEKQCLIPFHPEHSLDRYHGFLFRRPA